MFALAMADSCSLNCCCSRSKKSVGDSLALVSLGKEGGRQECNVTTLSHQILKNSSI